MTAAVIGGGLTGCLVALDLAEHGIPVVLFESEPGVMLRASLANEGKIHLGYVYSADATFRTAKTLIDDALLFRPLMQKWMTSAEFDACLTDIFNYIIPEDSNLPPHKILSHFSRVEAYLRDRECHLGKTYLGEDHENRHDVHSFGSGACFASRERAVWPSGISHAVRSNIAKHDLIDVRTNTRVDAIHPFKGHWRIAIADQSAQREGPFEYVVNASWADRRRIDRASGFASHETWFTRYKFGVLLENAAEAFGGTPPKNGTGTSGSFGDSVYYPQNDSLYCSWYPVGMCFTSQDDATDFHLDAAGKSEHLARATWQGYSEIDPDYKSLATCRLPLKSRLIGDFIVAKGHSDIVDVESQLHKRHTHGPRELGRKYWSVDTGKYSSAPRCAAQCVAAVLGTV